MVDNVLVLKYQDQRLEVERHRVVVPPIRETFFDAYHGTPTVGHFGFDRCYTQLRSRFYWPGMGRIWVAAGLDMPTL